MTFSINKTVSFPGWVSGSRIISLVGQVLCASVNLPHSLHVNSIFLLIGWQFPVLCVFVSLYTGSPFSVLYYNR